MKEKISLILHGGCGSPRGRSAFDASITHILEMGRERLNDGASALDAVEFCVSELENDPLFNAGRGSVLNDEGKIEMEAGIMDGCDLSAGAVAGVQRVKNVVGLARLVKERSKHVLLIGNGAMDFARSHDVPFETDDYFVTEQRVEQLAKAKEEGGVALDHSEDDRKLGTVGAVARDEEGGLAAATSTGGLTNKQYGRVGDSPIIGAGVFADNKTCGVSSTGIGEDFLRTSIAKEIDLNMRSATANARRAAQKGIDYLVEKVDGQGGVIVIDRNGMCGFAHSTELLIAGYIERNDTIHIVE